MNTHIIAADAFPRSWLYATVGLGALVAFAITFYLGRALRRREREMAEMRDQYTSSWWADSSGGIPHGSRPTFRSWPVQRSRESTEGGHIPEVPQALIDACVLGECILFAGGGVALQAGFPTWGRALDGILRYLESHDRPEAAGLRPLMNSGDRDGVAELLRTRLSEEDLIDLLSQTVRTGSAPPSDLLDTLARVPFAGVLTNTWDNAMERVFVSRSPVLLTPTTTIDFAGLFRESSFFILKVFGDLGRGDVRFTPEEYRRSVYENSEYFRFCASLFSTRTLLFLGMTHDSIEDFLSSTAIHGRPDRPHFALVERTPGVELQQERLESKYNLHLLVFDPTDRFPEVGRFTSRLALEVRRRRPTEHRPILIRPELLSSVQLANIGPFESLTLDMTPTWNVLLGNNGCGKSTILRAIALGLCGDDDRLGDTSRRLLRSGASAGSIQLRIGSNLYQTDLVRDGSRVRAISKQITPVQSGSWLVLGFPPLRGMTSRRMSGPSVEGSSNPEVDDLLPLVDGRVDARFDDLKQWMINASLAPGHDQGRQMQMFLNVLKAIVPAQLEFDEIDTATWDVLVRTSDGIVPIESISQGMSSALGWVGVLVQRLCEVYGGPDPAQREALVLVDELDAHLHPEWQSLIVPAIRECFPRLQVIATTHSPFIVGSLDRGEASHLRREIDGRVAIRKVDQSFKGWRADQILTGPAFEMSGARDNETTRLLDEYRDLIAKQQLTPDDKLRIDEITAMVDQTVPSHQELEESREAAALVKEWMAERLRELPDDQKLKVLAEAKIYLASIKSGR